MAADKPPPKKQVPPEGSGLYFLRNFLSRADDPDSTVLNEEDLAKKIAQRAFERAELKQVVKEAIAEWMDCKWKRAGETLGQGILIILFASVVLLLLWIGGVRR